MQAVMATIDPQGHVHNTKPVRVDTPRQVLVIFLDALTYGAMPVGYCAPRGLFLIFSMLNDKNLTHL